MFHPQLPIIVRSLNPAQKVWKKIFNIIQQAGINFEWLELMCRAPPKDNTTSVVLQSIGPKILSSSSESSAQAQALFDENNRSLYDNSSSNFVLSDFF